jgi:hypothetical protein
MLRGKLREQGGFDMIFQRFGLICLGSALFGIWFALLVQEGRADRSAGLIPSACQGAFHPACPAHGL